MNKDSKIRPDTVPIEGATDAPLSRVPIEGTTDAPLSRSSNRSRTSPTEQTTGSRLKRTGHDGVTPEVAEHWQERTLITELDRSYEEDQENSSGEETAEEDTEADNDNKSHLLDAENPDVDNGYDTDLEIDDEEWLHGQKEYDPSGVKDYIKECNRIGVIPVKYFLRHVRDTSFIMKNHGLGPLGAKAISKAFEMNTSIETINLEGNCIKGGGAKCFARVLRDSIYISEIYLQENNIGSKGASSICEMLLENSTLKVLDLSGNQLKDSDGEMFYRLLEKNSTLRMLKLRHNEFHVRASEWFKEALASNETLRCLDLSWNHLRLEGAINIAEGVKENYGLKVLNLNMNGFGFEGAKAMGHALKHNQSLEELDLSANRITEEGAIEIAKGLKVNDVLQIIKLGHNPIPPDGTTTLMMAVQRNDNSNLTVMQLEDIIVEQKFEDIKDQVKETRLLHVVHAGVFSNNVQIPKRRPPLHMDRKTQYWNDPMTKLKRYADKKKMRLVELFREFDKDGSWTISPKEFMIGIKQRGIPLTNADIAVLVLNLDADGDGEINYRELLDGAHYNRIVERELLDFYGEDAFKDEMAAEDRVESLDPLADSENEEDET